ncbi:hypothetical protein OF83DRAFT_1069948 [Amylostereum chailletii]|nr:hypothetical protein OF83DRAFT_1069948 [Amylostereum chailletii]
MRKIDVHHHFFPSTYRKADVSAAVGFRTPPEHLPWTPDLSLQNMDALGVELAILSVPAGYPHGIDMASLTRARDANRAMADICALYPRRFAFWGCLGDWRDVDSAVNMISYVLDDLHAVGIAVASSYGDGGAAKYIGDDLFDPVWEGLNRRNTVIFLHGAQTPHSTPIPHAMLGLPITEVPNETAKAIAHLVVSGKTKRYGSLSFLLAHLGGTTTSIAPRVAALARYMGATLSEAQILDEFRKCWWDSALCTGAAIGGAYEVVSKERVVWGSDFPGGCQIVLLASM